MAHMDAAQLRAEAERCRVLASAFANQSTVEMLIRMAAEFERAAADRETQPFLLRGEELSNRKRTWP